MSSGEDFNTPYNNTAWNSDPPHIARTIVNCSVGSLIFLITLAVVPVVIIRMGKFPLKAHGRMFQFQKVLSMLFVSAFFICFMFLNKLWMSLFIVYMPLACLFPTVLRCWNIYLTLSITLIKTQINASNETENLLTATQHTSLRWRKFFLGKAFVAIISVILFIIHLIIWIPCIPIFLSGNTYKSLFYAIALAGATAVVYGLIILVLCVQLIRIKLRENFHILQGVFGNLVMILLTIAFVSYYGAALIASAFVTDWYAGYVVYSTFIPIDLLLMTLLFVDLIISTLVPTIHTFFWKNANSNPDASDEIDAILLDKESNEDFKNFSAKEFSLENIVFYEQHLKLKKVELTLLNYAELYNAFVKENASLQLNLDYKLFTAWKRAVDQKNMEDLKAAFDKTISMTKTNMQDTLSRFQLTEPYRKWHSRYTAFKSLGWQEKNKKELAAEEAAAAADDGSKTSRSKSIIAFFTGGSNENNNKQDASAQDGSNGGTDKKPRKSIFNLISPTN